MTQYLVAIHHPVDYDPSLEDEAMHSDIDALNDAMNAAGRIVFVGGLQPEKTARAVRRGPGGAWHVTDGPYLETKELIGGFWVLDCPTEEEALEWGRKAAIACRAPVEVRPFHDMPTS